MTLTLQHMNKAMSNSLRPAEANDLEDVVSESLETDKDSSTGESEQPLPKFTKAQRVYAKDTEYGLLYEGVVRRSIFGTRHQRQLNISHVETEQDVDNFFQQLPDPPTWHYFVHYSGWNVRWDRWVEESQLYEATEATKRFAKRISDEIKLIKERFKRHTTTNAVKMAAEIEKMIVVVEREKNIEERRENLKMQGIAIKLGGDNENKDKIETKQKKWTKNHVVNELKLRDRHLQSRRNQAHADLLVLPLALKKIMVEEWEIITQCGMIPDLPVKVTVKDALHQYLASKLALLEMVGNATKDEEAMDAIDPKQEWRDMVHGILLFFDQGIPDRLLYPQEIPQHDFIYQSGRRNCEIYGCEFLLRMFVRLPSQMSETLSVATMRPILSKVNDLVRFLLKNQETLFLQSYRKRVAEGDEVVTKKRRRTGPAEYSSRNNQAPSLV